jgi:hypothetical protein
MGGGGVGGRDVLKFCDIHIDPKSTEGKDRSAAPVSRFDDLGDFMRTVESDRAEREEKLFNSPGR